MSRQQEEILTDSDEFQMEIVRFGELLPTTAELHFVNERFPILGQGPSLLYKAQIKRLKNTATRPFPSANRHNQLSNINSTADNGEVIGVNVQVNDQRCDTSPSTSIITKAIGYCIG